MKPYYQDDLATIYNCDWRELMPIKADLVIADPPYGISIVKKTNEVGRGLLAKTISYSKVANDHSPAEAKECFTALSYIKKQIWWGANHYGDVMPDSSCWLVWDKDNGKTDFADCELAWTNLDSAVRLLKHRWHGMLRASEPKRWHPTQKPVVLMNWCIKQAKLEPRSIVFDPFMGSGPVGVAAKSMGHFYIGAELSEKYCEIAAKRLSQDYLFGAI